MCSDIKDFITKYKTILWICAVVLIIMLSLPFLLTRRGFIDFSQTGQIGDTIGGIIGPFVAIIAAALTFVAFYVQYQANKFQREDIARERAENEIFELIRTYSSIVSSIEVHGKRGKTAFAELAGEWAYTYRLLTAIFKKEIAPNVSRLECSTSEKEVIIHLSDNIEDRIQIIIIIHHHDMNIEYFRIIFANFLNSLLVNLL